MPDPNPITEAASAATTSTGTAAAPTEIPSINPEIVERAKRIAAASPDLITFASGVKAAFEDMTKVLSPGDLPEDEVVKTNEGKIAAIQKIGEVGGEKINDSGLKTFANAATRILNINPENPQDNSEILKSLIKAFGFLGEEGPRKKDSKEDITLSILEAVHKATSSCGENKAAVDAINSGFKEAFPGLGEEEAKISASPPSATSTSEYEEEGRKLISEEQRIRDEKKANWDSAMEIMPDAIKGTVALTLALAVPPPLGVILAIGFLAYTWDMGHKPEEEKPEIFNDPDVQEYAEAWKKYMKPQQEITDEDRENYEKDQTALGKVASRVIIEGGANLKESEKTLKTSKKALRSTGGAGVAEANLTPPDPLELRSITKKESKEKSTTGEAPTIEEELKELMNEFLSEPSKIETLKKENENSDGESLNESFVATFLTEESKKSSARLVDKENEKLSKEELKAVATSLDVPSEEGLENTLQSMTSIVNSTRE